MSHELWVVTCYFNPARYQSRLRNYRQFHRQVGAPLLTVEWSSNGTFDLHDGDADRLLRVAGGDLMWQKERLLNLGIAALPSACDQVAWIDCDAALSRPDWVTATRAALDDHPIAQLFHQRYNLGPGSSFGSAATPTDSVATESLVHRWRGGRATDADFWDPDAPRRRGSTAGLAWAARRDLVERHGLYDACVVGSGDRAMACAAVGRPEWGERALGMSPAWARHYHRWAQRFYRDVRAGVGCVEGGAAHLWHGHLHERRYARRTSLLRDGDYDPEQDLATTDQGCWRWASTKPRMHDAVRAYFFERREDG